jgi:hypothetical protein
MASRSTAAALPTPKSPESIRRLTLIAGAGASNTGTTSRTAQDNRLITVTFDIAEAHAPALRSAIEEISDAVATRVEGKFTNATEHALTCALVGLGQLRAALYPQVPAGDPNYRGRRA